ncbi:MAG TPA: hypothetical protein PKB10_15645 [Tepidisphaeraceae bacterium]|nr:hypothetical protein [Tepidisphaeraceae bacterium]
MAIEHRCGRSLNLSPLRHRAQTASSSHAPAHPIDTTRQPPKPSQDQAKKPDKYGHPRTFQHFMNS